MASITLTDEQARAVAEIIAFIEGPRVKPFVLNGLAGTGKTTVLAAVAKQFPDAILCTLTGKAASILRRKTGLQACTIHSAFYRLIGDAQDKRGRRAPQFETVHHEGDLTHKIVLIDECSMINHELAADIIRTGAKIVAVGDPGQLPPVTGERFFNWSDITLETVHRQAWDSPIIRQAHAVRDGQDYVEDGLAFRVIRGQASDADLLSVDVILSYTHATRKAANAEARRIRGFWQPFPQAGEPLICLRNAKAFGIFNGAIYTLIRPFIQGDTDILIDVDGEAMEIPNVTFAGVASGLDDGENATTSFDFGYALTVHKGQGSEWDNVLLLDEYRRREQRVEWLYTGITRAAKNIIILR